MTETRVDQGRLTEVILEGDAAASPEGEMERRIAIYDLIENVSLGILPTEARPVPPPGPYRMTLGIRARSLSLRLAAAEGAPAAEIDLSIASFRKILKDYAAYCEGYVSAVRSLPVAEIERFDEARRAAHDEGAALLREKLADRLALDENAARRLFTLLAALQYRG